MDNKIETYLNIIGSLYYTNMKPVYSTNDELMCGVIDYNKKTYFLDINDKDRIINFNKNFVFINENDIYPSYLSNYKRVNYLDFIFNYNKESVYYKFKNNNPYDLRRCNIVIYHHYHKNIMLII